jgi:hypothetical protein
MMAIPEARGKYLRVVAETKRLIPEIAKRKILNAGPVERLGIDQAKDPECQAEPGTIHESAPKRARYSPTS